MFNKRNLIIGLVVILGLVFLFIPKGKNSKYITVPVERKTIVQTVEASGTVNPVETVSIGSQISGIIKNIYVDFNSEVKKGQLLAEIDPAISQAQVDQDMASLNSKKSNYKKAKATLDYNLENYKRYEKLYKKNYVSRDEMELAKATYLAQKATVDAAREDVKQAEASLTKNLTNLRYTKIISPVDGVVISKEVEKGQTVAASFQTPTLFSVARDLTKMQIETSVSEADIGKVKVGQEVNYTLDGYQDKVFKGRVSQVRLASTTTNNVVTYTVIVSVDNNEGILVPGMTANVEIVTSKKENVLTVPNIALKFTPETNKQKFEKQGIWVLHKGKLERIEIEVGVSDDNSVEIISDEVNEGSEVVVGGNNPKDKRKSNPMRHPPM